MLEKVGRWSGVVDLDGRLKAELIVAAAHVKPSVWRAGETSPSAWRRHRRLGRPHAGHGIVRFNTVEEGAAATALTADDVHDRTGSCEDSLPRSRHGSDSRPSVHRGVVSLDGV